MDNASGRKLTALNYIKIGMWKKSQAFVFRALNRIRIRLKRRHWFMWKIFSEFEPQETTDPIRLCVEPYSA